MQRPYRLAGQYHSAPSLVCHRATVCPPPSVQVGSRLSWPGSCTGSLFGSLNRRGLLVFALCMTVYAGAKQEPKAFACISRLGQAAMTLISSVSSVGASPSPSVVQHGTAVEGELSLCAALFADTGQEFQVGILARVANSGRTYCSPPQLQSAERASGLEGQQHAASPPLHHARPPGCCRPCSKQNSR